MTAHLITLRDALSAADRLWNRIYEAEQHAAALDDGLIPKCLINATKECLAIREKLNAVCIEMAKEGAS